MCTNMSAHVQKYSSHVGLSYMCRWGSLYLQKYPNKPPKRNSFTAWYWFNWFIYLFILLFVEPRNFTCVSCQLTVSSAWVLMQHAQHKHNICIYMDDQLGSTPLAPRVKREDLEPGEVNNSKLGHDVMNDDVMMDTKQPRNEQGHSPSVHSNRTPHKENVSGSDLLRHRSTSSSAMTPPRDMSLPSQHSTPRSGGSGSATTPPPSMNMDMLSPSASSLMFRMPHPESANLSCKCFGTVWPSTGLPSRLRSQPRRPVSANISSGSGSWIAGNIDARVWPSAPGNLFQSIWQTLTTDSGRLTRWLQPVGSGFLLAASAATRRNQQSLPTVSRSSSSQTTVSHPSFFPTSAFNHLFNLPHWPPDPRRWDEYETKHTAIGETQILRVLWQRFQISE